MRFAILLCIVAFTCASEAFLFFDPIVADSAEAEPSDQSHQLPPLLQAAINKLQEFKDGVDRAIDAQIGHLQQKAFFINQKAQGLIDNVKQKAEELTSSNSRRVNDIVDKAQQEVDLAALDAESFGVDVTRCRTMMDNMRHLAHDVVVNSSRCVLTKLEEGQNITRHMANRTAVVIHDIRRIRNESGLCLRDVGSIQQAVGASVCLTKTGAKATWAITKQVPSLAIDVVKFLLLLQGLPTSLPTCVSQSAIDTMNDQAERVKKSVIQCIRERIESAVHKPTHQAPPSLPPPLPPQAVDGDEAPPAAATTDAQQQVSAGEGQEEAAAATAAPAVEEPSADTNGPPLETDADNEVDSTLAAAAVDE